MKFKIQLNQLIWFYQQETHERNTKLISKLHFSPSLQMWPHGNQVLLPTPSFLLHMNHLIFSLSLHSSSEPAGSFILPRLSHLHLSLLIFWTIKQKFVPVQWLNLEELFDSPPSSTKEESQRIRKYLHPDPGWSGRSGSHRAALCIFLSVPRRRFQGRGGLTAGTAPKKEKFHSHLYLLHLQKG